MKEGWTYKKIGDICDIKTGKLDANAASLNGVYPFFTCSKETLCIDRYSYDCECVLIAGNGDLNVKYYNGKFDAYQRTYIVTIKPQYKSISTYYLYKFFCKYIERLRQLSIGGVIKYIKLGNLTDACIPVPPIGEQERIVAELDLLLGVIEKKKEQLKAYDQLAQSIFYTMFGDPIDNPKGWEYIKLSSLINDNVILYHLDGNHGGDYPRSDEFVNEGVPYIGANCICDGLVNFSMAKYLPIDRANKLRKGLAKNGDVLFAHNATVGPVAYLNTKEPLVILSTSLTAYRCNENKLNPLFLRAYMQSTWFESQYKVSMKQTTRNQIPITQQKKMNFILPPLSLQEEFAEKVEAIERQKGLVQQSIEETQTMFDFTMDKYFG